MKVDIDNPFEKKCSTLIDQGQTTLQRMEESANPGKARFKLEQESANRAKDLFDLNQNKDEFFARLKVAKAMIDYKELAKLKEEANELPLVQL